MQPLSRPGRGTGFICVTLATLAALGMSLKSMPDIRTSSLVNPDSYMRLVRLREMMDSGHVSFAAARDGSGHGTVLHWSHLLDSLLYVLALPFGLFMDAHDAIYAAALLFGPLNFAALGFAIVWAAAPFAERKWLWLGAILPVLSPAIASYGMIGVVHHHIAIAIAATACLGWAARLIAGRAPYWAGIALGAWIGLGCWFTPESVPLTLMAFGALFLGWIAYPARIDLARAIGLSGLSFALVTGLAVLADPPDRGLSALDIDRISMVFAGLALAVAATGVALWALHGLVTGRFARLAAACGIALFCAAVWAFAFRNALLSGNMLLDEEQRSAMFGHIVEMLPIGDVPQALQMLLTGAWATLLLVLLAVRRRSLPLAYAAACLTGLMVLGWLHVRFAAYPELAGALALPVALSLASAATLTWHQIFQSFTRLAIILLFIQVPYLAEMPALMGSAQAAPFGVIPACRLTDAIPLLTPHPGAVVLADVNDTPEILWKTGVRTVGSLYHRNIDGFLRLRAAWRVPPSDVVPPEIDAAEVSLVLTCKTPARSSLVEDISSATLLDQLRTGHPPAWLREIDENPRSGHVLYEVTRAAR